MQGEGDEAHHHQAHRAGIKDLDGHNDRDNQHRHRLMGRAVVALVAVAAILVGSGILGWALSRGTGTCCASTASALVVPFASPA